MPLRTTTDAALLDLARGLVNQSNPDIKSMLEMLDNLSSNDLDIGMQGTMAHARLVAAASLNKSSAHATVARYALARVIVLLEKRVAEGI